VAFRADTLVDARAALDRGDAFWIVAVIYFTLAVISALLIKRRQAHG